MARSVRHPSRFHVLGESLAHRDYIHAGVVTFVILVSALFIIGKMIHSKISK